MGNVHHPRRGSMQFWPRKRSRHSLVRVRSWSSSKANSLLGFVGYKVGMATAMTLDNRPKSMTKGEVIAQPVTIIECPPLKVAGVSFYKKGLLGLSKTGFVFADKLDKDLKRKIPLPKKTTGTIPDTIEFDELRLLVQTQPKLASVDTKIPALIEIKITGSKDDQLAFAKNHLGKEIFVADVFEQGVHVDVHGVTKGKGFQGTVKRFGVPIRQHKAEKTKRGIATLGSWTPKRIEFTVPQSGKMGYHLRTEYNKQVLRVSPKAEGITPKGGFAHYGVLKNQYVLLKGSFPGPIKSSVVFTLAIRPDTKIPKDAFTIKEVLA